MTQSTRRLIENATGKAMTEFIASRSVLIMVDDPHDGPRVATGTCLHLGARYFVATCAHILRHVPLPDIRVCDVRNGKQRPVPIIATVVEGGGDYDRIDVGAIEISAAVAQRLERTFVTLDEIDFGARAERGVDSLYLYGCPSALFRPDTSDQGAIRYTPFCWGTDPLAIDRYPATADVDLDIAFEYSEQGEYGDGERLIPTPDLPGFSGGSIWRLDRNFGAPLVGPQHSKWIAIQRAWVKATRIAYGNKMASLSSMLRRNYEDLCDVLPPEAGF